MKNYTLIRAFLINLILVVENNCFDYFVDHSDFFRNKVILAPMLQVNTLSFRILALEQGADIVYSEEITDYKLIQCERKPHDFLANVIEYVNKDDGTVVFQTCIEERGRVIIQIGITDPKVAVEAASMVQRDVAGIDINLEYSDLDLLKNLTAIQATLKQIRKAVCVPVTCKIRILPTIEETESLCKNLEMTGISAIAMHGRTIHEKPWKPNRNHFIQNITREISIPIIACGGSNHIESYDDILKFKKGTNSSSVMIARAAQYDCSIFRKTNASSTDTLIQRAFAIDTLIPRYVMLAIRLNDSFSKVQYCVSKMLKRSINDSLIEQFSRADSMEKMSKIFNLHDYYREAISLSQDYYKKLEKMRSKHSQTAGRKRQVLRVLSGIGSILLQVFVNKVT